MTTVGASVRRVAAWTARPGVFSALFLAGLLLRLVIVSQTGALDTTIVDEQHYRQLAHSLVAGDGFAWGPGQPTSLRPPLYPALLALVWSSGTESLQAVRVIQIVLAIATMWLVYLLGTRLYDPLVGRIAAIVVWLYPSLIFLNVLILTETLFTLMLTAFVLMAVTLVSDASRPGGGTPWVTALGCGAVLGLGALTRSVLWPLPILLCPLLLLLVRRPLTTRLTLAALVLAGYAIVVGPWAVRNTRLQEVVTIVDTMGGLNLRMGNYEYTPDDRMWDAVALQGEKNWVHGLTIEPGLAVTEGRKDKWAQREAFRYMLDHPHITLRRSFIKLADFWGLEREFIAGARDGLFDPPSWFVVVAGAAILAAYVVVAVMGVAGAWLAPPADWRLHLLALLPAVFIMGIHALAFGHSRYHVPLVPILAVYAAALATRDAGRTWTSAARTAALISVGLLLLVWVRQVVFVDWDRIQALIG